MRRFAFVLALALLGLTGNQAQAVPIQSWENTQGGWTVVTTEGNSTYSVTGYSTTTGVTDGTYSIVIEGVAPPSYGQLWRSTTNLGNTAILASAATISIDVLATGNVNGNPVWNQWELTYNNADTGYNPVDGTYDFSQSSVIGQQSTLTWTVPQSVRDAMAASTNGTALFFQVGGGGATTMYIDNLRYELVPEPGTLSLLAMGGLGLLALARRRK